MANSLLKTAAHNSFADAIYLEILSRATRYYYFVGKTLSWTNEAIPPVVVDSRSYERDCRNEIIAFKEITPSDISFVVPRIDWATNNIYDIYDDQYSSEIQGLNLQSGGSIYAVTPTIIIGDIVPTSLVVVLNTQYYYNGFLYTVTSVGGATGSSNTVLLGVMGTSYTHGTTVLTCVGVQATATCTVGTSGVNNQKVISTTITNKGYGYAYPPSVTFSSGTAAATTVITHGLNNVQKLEDTQYYVYNDTNVYICIDNNGNSVSTVAPTGISSSYLNTADGYTWKYMSSVTSNSKFLITNYLPIFTATKNQYNANGSIVNIFIDNAGMNYLSAPITLPLSTAVLLGDQYNANGYVYTVTALPLPLSSSAPLGTVYYYNGYVYTVTTAGTTASSYSGLGTTPGASYTNGTAIFICNGLPTTSSSYSGLGTTVGTPYSNGTASLTCNGLVTTISVVGDGINASLTPLITNGNLTGVQVNNAGTGYTYANFSVNGSGNSATISSALTSAASQYSHQAQIEDAVINGNICSIQLLSGGYGYTNPSVLIVGDGTGATATVSVVNSIITKITIANRGSNYNWANIVITDSTGAGASARAIMSPFGGLGKDPINQLSSRTLMFYTKLSDNTNQGLAVTNDYRQVGIIKDPIRYSDGTFLTSNFASPCWKITATTNIDVGISVDDIVSTTSNSITYRFRVVAIAGLDILLIPLDNGIPTSGMQFVLTSSIYFNAAYVTPPSADKYSGDLLFIDNESTFVATTSSPAILRTIIKL